MNSLRKNIPLLGFVGLTIIVALVVTVMDVQTYVGYLNAKTEITLYMSEITANNQKKPSCYKGNLDAIESDAKQLRKAINEVQSRYGKIHRPALKEFAAGVNSTEEELLAKFKSFYDSLPDDKKAINSGENDRDIFDCFIATFYEVKQGDLMNALAEKDPKLRKKLEEMSTEEYNKIVVDKKKKAVVDEALNVFYKYARNYVEYKKSDTEYKCLLEALGLPTTDRLGNLRTLLEGYYNEWVAMIPGLEAELNKEEQEKRLRILLVDPGALERDQLGLAYRQIQIRQDLFNRMKAAKVEKVVDLKILSSKGNDMMNEKTADPLKGVLKGKFLYYTYEVKISGSMESIRAFLNSMSQAYVNNRIYNVRDLSLSRELDEEKSENITKTFSENIAVKIEDNGTVVVPETYGKTVIGKNPAVDCTIVFDYIMYVDDMIQRKQSGKE